jgi:hypothetical protein
VQRAAHEDKIALTPFPVVEQRIGIGLIAQIPAPIKRRVETGRGVTVLPKPLLHEMAEGINACFSDIGILREVEIRVKAGQRIDRSGSAQPQIMRETQLARWRVVCLAIPGRVEKR